MSPKHVKMYMEIADTIARQSYAVRLKVGAVAVASNRILSIGYNGTPPGWDNNCEVLVSNGGNGTPTLVTKPEVIHAEANCILKMARDGQPALGADLFITHAPCVECAKMIVTAGFNRVFWRDQYRSTDGLDILAKSHVIVEKV